jgi:hypothetical protein
MATAAKPHKPYKTHWYNRRLSYWFNKYAKRSEGTNVAPPVIRLAAPKPSKKPPVRIFLGTEPAQHRAERVFVYALEKVRNPSRAYEIHLMSDVAGIDRSTWKTGFTNYRYCIPTWAGGKGRAIYNDVDQIYLADPAEMFDMELNGKGIAAISEQENSVMLIDCEKMVPFWNIDAVRGGGGHAQFKKLVSDNGLFHPLPGVWNARDGEFPVAESKCIHYTTLHTQPWEPFPDQLRYEESPVAHVWRELEAAADEEDYTQPKAS